MNQPPVALPPDVPPSLHGGVKVFAALLILAGAGCAGIFLLVLAAALLAPTGAESMPLSVAISASLMYLLIGAGFVVLGIGAWRLRRWSRPLILTLGWCWLIAGVMGTAIVAFVMPRLLQPFSTTDSEAAFGCVVVMVVGMCVLMLAVPIALVLFFGRASVRALFDRRDPGPAWTDRTHPVLLGIAVLMWVGALGGLTALSYPALPMFGKMVEGWPLRLICLAGAALCAWIGWAVYRRQLAGFWALVAVQVLSLVNILFMAGMDEATMYRGMGYSEAEVSQMTGLGMFQDPVVFGAMLLSWLVLTLALFAVRKHFVPASRTGSAAPPPV